MRLRAARWLACGYPRAWRARYGEEFDQLLFDQLRDGRVGLRWWVDLGWHGLRARAVAAGLGAIACVVAAFVVCALAIWSQLAVGWQWSAPASPQTRAGMEAVSGGLIGLLACGVLAIVVLCLALVRTIRAREGGSVSVPWSAVVLAVLAVAGLILGAGRVGLAWPGSGGHAWAGRALVPAWLARRGWALTLWVSAYWAHPRSLARLGDVEVGWMVACPLLIVALAWALRRLAGLLVLGRRLRTVLLGLAVAAVVPMASVLAGAVCWALGGATGPHGLFVPGTIDLALLAIAAGAFAGAVQLSRIALLVA